jgi:subtilase family serine protease
MEMKVANIVASSLVLAFGLAAQPASARMKVESTSPRLGEATILQREVRANQHSIVVGLDLRNRDELERFLADVQDPASPNYGRFLTQDEFNARYAPTADA